VVFSPRASLLFKPTPNQTMRVSFNQAFRAPSYINNNLDVALLNQVNLSAINPALSQVVFPFAAVGNPDLTEERLTAFELGYSSVLMNRATVSVAVYWNQTDDGIFFTQAGRYTTANPPPFTQPPVPPIIWSLIPDPGVPSVFTYQNLGTYKDKGFEIGVDTVINRYFNGFINYSYQADPVVENFDESEINHPANNRFNIGVNFNYERYLGYLTVSYTDEAYWQDVLDARYAGTTDPFTLVNFAFGLKWMNERLVTSAKVMNLLNQEVQQHVFGDIMKRQVVGEVRFTF
jgi:outer membrane receptor protein involved in Fe transport